MPELHHYLEAIAFITGIVLFLKTWPIAYKLLVLLSGISMIVEIAGKYFFTGYSKELFMAYNQLLYNIYLPVLGGMQFIIFYKIASSQIIKKATLAILFLFVLALGVSWVYHINIYKFNPYGADILCICSIMSAAAFYVDVLINNVEIPLLRQPSFWFASGVFVSSALEIARFSFWNILLNYPASPTYLVIHNLIVPATTIVMYGSYIATFLCLRINRKFYSL